MIKKKNSLICGAFFPLKNKTDFQLRLKKQCQNCSSHTSYSLNKNSKNLTIFYIKKNIKSTYKVVCCKWNILQHFYMQFLSSKPGNISVPANWFLLPEKCRHSLSWLSYLKSFIYLMLKIWKLVIEGLVMVREFWLPSLPSLEI